MISTIVLTKNESRDIVRCLTALGWCDDIHLVDSGSTDDTVELAQNHGAKIYHHEFASFGTQRNWALDNCTLKYDWILFLDADELSTDAFAAAVKAACTGAADDIAGFYCCWKMIWREQWLRRCDSYPKWQFRILRRGRARFTDFGHGQKESEVAGKLSRVSEPYLHYFMSKGLHHWVARHNRYSDEEAAVRSSSHANWSQVFSSAGSQRNQALRILLTRIPGWPALRFVWMYLFKLGFLEGRPGFAYCMLLAYYEFLIKQKITELTQKNGCQF